MHLTWVSKEYHLRALEFWLQPFIRRVRRTSPSGFTVDTTATDTHLATTGISADMTMTTGTITNTGITIATIIMTDILASTNTVTSTSIGTRTGIGTTIGRTIVAITTGDHTATVIIDSKTGQGPYHQT
jgi:uncharacterized YccA/Bax inhibitor family protein